ncbi:MAG: glucosaminidase domain-containing protein [Spirochaetaceae bacterium]|nr:glucosaminidase domain-containing protein [Spirochaetaceae bacterium]
MKNRKITFVLAAVVALAFIAVNGFCEEPKIVPFTWEIFSNVRNELTKLDFYFSKPFSLRINGQNNSNMDVNGGMLIPGGNNNSSEILRFTVDVTGKLDNISDVPQGREVLEISFPNPNNTKKNIRFKFARNMNKNRFELAFAVIDTVNYNLRFPDEAPYLTIKSTINIPNTEARAVPISDEHNNSPQIRQGNTDSVSISNINQVTDHNRYGAIFIAGQGSLSRSALMRYIRTVNIHVSERTLGDLIDCYLLEAHKEGINSDLAIAQMCRTTSFLRNENIMQTYNYAGFTSTPGWSGRFSSMRQGVIAHIQHLKGYTSDVRSYDLKSPLYDPRWNMLGSFRGTIRTLEALSEKWTPYNARVYENDIRTIINEMRRYGR